VPCTLGLIEHRKKPKEPALDTVRETLLGLKAAPGGKVRRRPGGLREPGARNATLYE
jgi:hypothetical protein